MTILGLGRTTKPAIIDGATGEVVTYRELVDGARDAYGFLARRKELIFLLAKNDVFSAASYAGALLSGHAIALLDAQANTDALAEILATYRPSWVAGPAGTGERLQGEGLAVEASSPLEGGELVRLARGSDRPVHPDLAVLLATSGTTGSKKLVRLSAVNIESNANSISEALALSPDERPISSLPFHYCFGLSVLNSHWLSGAAVVVSGESVMQRPFWEQFEAQECTSLAGVPYTYQLLERIGFRQMGLPSLRSLQQAGGALDRHLTTAYREHMEGRGGKLFVMYGQTEATARIAVLPPELLGAKLGSAGKAIPGGHLRIEGDRGGAGGEPPVGEVVYEGPNVMLGYASTREDIELGDVLGGTLRTGDLGFLDGDGCLFLVGRTKRIAKVFGLRVNLDEVEAHLREHGPAAAVALPDLIIGFCAFGSEESLDELSRSVARRMRLHHSALELRRVDDIPTVASGKTDYEQVNQWVTS